MTRANPEGVSEILVLDVEPETDDDTDDGRCEMLSSSCGDSKSCF